MFKLFTKNKIQTLSIKDLTNKEGCLEALSKYMGTQDAFDSQREKYGYSYSKYITLQNVLSVLYEHFFNEDRFDESLLNMIEKVEDIHMPSWPPMSPMSNSYFSYWAFLDARYEGGESFAEYILRNKGELLFPDDWIDTIKNLSISRMGIYEHLGFTSDDKITFNELVTDNKLCTVNAAGYQGNKGDLCFLRVALPLIPEDEHVILGTPYVLCGHSKQEWVNYFERQGINNGNSAMMDNFMKNWPSYDYWHEFIFEGYTGFKSSHIYLKGIPDIKGTKPHE